MSDWSIAVGIGKYPAKAFPMLKGAEADAREFHKWVTSREGGGVLPRQAKLIVSPASMPKSPVTAKPAAEQVSEFFERMHDIAQKRDTKMVGRRLYMYFSGHGFAPEADEVGLLMANADRDRLKHHIPGKAWANLFYASGYFEQVLLFMDCCRTVMPKGIPNHPSIFVNQNPQAMQNGKRLFVFATKWGAETREREFEGKSVRGVFTMALLDGLRGMACEPGTNRVTARSLRSYFHNSMRNYLPSEALQDPAIPEEPEIEPSQTATSDFEIVQVANGPEANPAMAGILPVVKIQVTNLIAGRRIRVLNGGLTEEIASTVAAPPLWEFSLPRGLYKVEVEGAGDGRLFEVKGTAKEVVNVDLG